MIDITDLGAEKLPGISTSEEAEYWVEEANRISRGVMTPRSERMLVSWQRLGAGNGPKGGAGSFASYDALIAAITAGQQYTWDFQKIAPSASQNTAGQWQTLWKGTGNPGAGSDPAGTPGAAYTDAAPTGGMYFPAPGGGQNKFVTTFGAISNQNCTLLVSDRLVGVGAIALGSTGSKTVSSAALTRYSTNTTALSNEAWAELTTAPTVTAPVMRMDSYTTGAGTSGQDAVASITLPTATTVVNWTGKFPLKAGTAGIQACSTANTTTAGTSSPAYSFIISRPLLYLPIAGAVSASSWNERDLVLQLMALPQIYDGAVLDFKIFAATNVTTTVWGQLRLAYG